MLLGLAVYGILHIDIYFGYDLFINEGFITREFLDVKRAYFPSTFEIDTYVNTPDVLIYEEEAQLQQYIFEEQMQRCETCSQPWFK